MPKLYYASPRDLPLIEPAAGLKGRVVQADHATMVIYDLAPKTIVESHKHEMEQFGVVVKGSLAMIIAGEQRILTEPKNAIVKQYQKFLALDKVELQLTQEALQAAAAGAAKRKTGARGLRTIIEEVLLDVMYEIPSRTDVRRVVVTPESINSGARPLLLSKNEQLVLEGDEATA